MTRGTTPMSNELRALRGGRSASPDRMRNNPVPIEQPVEKPDGLPDDVSAIWDRLVSQVLGMKLAKAVDQDALVMVCRTLAAYNAAQRILDDEGLMMGERRHPMTMVANQKLQEFMVLSARFGLTPGDRAKIILPKEEGTEGEDFFAAS